MNHLVNHSKLFFTRGVKMKLYLCVSKKVVNATTLSQSAAKTLGNMGEQAKIYSAKAEEVQAADTWAHLKMDSVLNFTTGFIF